MKIRSLSNVKIGKVRYKRAVDFPYSKGIPRDEMREIVKNWLEDNCEGRYYYFTDVKFESKQDALMFYIRFA